MAYQPDHQYRLFVSFAEADKEWVEGYLLDALHLPGECVMTNRSTTCSETFQLGVATIEEFERAVAHSRYTVLVLSRAYLTDEWSAYGEQLASHASVTQQRDRLIPLLKEECKLPLRIEFRVRLDCTNENNWETEIARLRALLDQPEPEPDHIECPYPGMVPFREEDAKVFHGREKETEEILQHFRHQRFLIVIGPSGSGKSSLIFAGLLPGLQSGKYFKPGFWKIKHMRPGLRPTQELGYVLAGDLTQPLVAVTNLLAANPPAQRLLLVVDQFEEVFNQVERAEQKRFLAALKALRAGKDCTLLIAMRADFYSDLMNSDLWPVEASQRMDIVPLRSEALREAIERPAMDVGLYLERSLAARLVADAADEPGVLPLLQEAMVLLWGQRKRRLLTLSAYEELGDQGRSGLAVAMAKKADATLNDLSSAKERAMARRIFLRLVQFGKGRPDTRRQQSVAELRSAGDDPEEFNRTLECLTQNRLLTLSSEGGDESKKVDIAHEALISGWPSLQGWLSERRSAEQTRRRLEQKAEEWVRLGSGSGGLLDEVELAEAERWLAGAEAADLGYNEGLSALVRASCSRVEANRRRRRYTLMALLSLLAVAVCVAVLAIQNGKTARRRESIASSRQFAAQALNRLEKRQLDQALQLCLRAYQTYDTFESRNCLLTALQYGPHLKVFLRGSTVSRSNVAFSPDGQTLASGDLLRGFILWDVATGKFLGPSIEDYTGVVYTVAFSPDGNTLALGGSTLGGGTIRLWDIRRRRLLDLSKGNASAAHSVVFSPSGKLLASVSQDNTVGLWDVGSLMPLPFPFREKTTMAYNVSFSPDGKLLASGSKNGTVILWDLATRKSVDLVLGRHSGDTYSVAFSPDNRILASGGSDGTVTLQSVKTYKPLGPAFREGPGAIYAIAFSPDGKALASGSEDGTIVLWDPATRKPIDDPLRGHANSVCSVAFSPDGKTLASFGCALPLWSDLKLVRGPEATVVLWDITGQTSLGSYLKGSTSPAESVAFSPDGKTIVTGDRAGTVAFWNVASRLPARESLRAYDRAAIQSMAFSHDGELLSTVSDDHFLARWDLAATPPLRQSFPGLSSAALSVAFSPDGKTLAVSTNDQTTLWGVMGEHPFCQLADEHSVEYMAFSPDGGTLALSNNVLGTGFVDLWDVNRCKRFGRGELNMEWDKNGIIE